MQGIGQAQGAPRGPTVGDTLSVVRYFKLPPGTLVQPRTSLDTSIATLTATPEVVREGDSVRVSYPIAVWSIGADTLRIPGPVIVLPDGTADTLPAFAAVLRVSSVLPAGAEVDTLTPADARGWVTSYEKSWFPVLLVLVPLLLITVIAARYWRRRGPARERTVSAPVRADADMLRRWLAAGEAGLVIDQLLPAMRERPEAVAWLEAVERIRYRSDCEPLLATLADEGIGMVMGGKGE